MFKKRNTGKIIKANGSTAFTMIPNSLAQDKSLSAGEKGLLVSLLSLPSDWCTYKSTLQNFNNNGRDALNTMFDNLVKKGYIIKTENVRDSGKMTGFNYVVYSEPQNAQNLQNSPVTGKPLTEKPLTENPSLQRNNIKRNNIQITHTHNASTTLSWDNKETVINTILKIQPLLGLDGAGAEAEEFLGYNKSQHNFTRPLTELLIKKWVSNSTKHKPQPQTRYFAPPSHQEPKKLRRI
jgi:hypothetical protein